MNDRLILKLLEFLNGRFIVEAAINPNGYRFYEVDIILDHKNYRLILTTPPDHSFLGVRNAYRRRK
jgi:hypothetical protein